MLFSAVGCYFHNDVTFTLGHMLFVADLLECGGNSRNLSFSSLFCVPKQFSDILVVFMFGWADPECVYPKCKKLKICYVGYKVYVSSE